MGWSQWYEAMMNFFFPNRKEQVMSDEEQVETMTMEETTQPTAGEPIPTGNPPPPPKSIPIPPPPPRSIPIPLLPSEPITEVPKEPMTQVSPAMPSFNDIYSMGAQAVMNRLSEEAAAKAAIKASQDKIAEMEAGVVAARNAHQSAVDALKMAQQDTLEAVEVQLGNLQKLVSLRRGGSPSQ